MSPRDVVLRPWQESDLPELVRLADCREVWRNLRDAFPHPYTAEAGRAWIAHASGCQPTTAFAVVADGALAGGIGYIPGQDVERCSAEIGYWIGAPRWGRGFATAAVRLLVEKVFAEEGIARLFAAPFAENLASRRVLEKAGFRLDAVLRHSAVKEGRLRDQALYSLVR